MTETKPTPPSESQTPEQESLLPCPFCGGKRITETYVRDGRAVGCIDCGARVSAFQPNASAHARTAWNKRLAAPRLVELVEKKDAIIEKVAVDCERMSRTEEIGLVDRAAYAAIGMKLRAVLRLSREA